MDIWLSPALGALLLLSATAWSRLAGRRRRAKQERLHNETLQLALELLQNLQKHRGLGPLTDAQSLRQRAAIAQQLDQLWQRWPSAACPPWPRPGRRCAANRRISTATAS